MSDKYNLKADKTTCRKIIKEQIELLKKSHDAFDEKNINITF